MLRINGLVQGNSSYVMLPMTQQQFIIRWKQLQGAQKGSTTKL